MPTIISTKKAKQFETLEVANLQLTKTVEELKEKLKEPSQDLASIQAAFDEDKAEWTNTVNNLKTEFTSQLSALKTEIEALKTEKVQIIESAKTEVEKAKEVKAEVIQEKVMEGVAVKVASMGLTEDKLPVNLSNGMTKKDPISIIVHRNNINSDSQIQ